ncbi:transposase, MuDR, MULE transposase domain protein [Tanacetum coccineum]
MRFPQTTAYLKYQTPIEEGGYDIWAMEIEHYLEYIDNEVWKIILNGNSKKRISTGKMSRKGYGENIMKSNKEETISIGTSQMLFLEEPMGVSTRSITSRIRTFLNYLLPVLMIDAAHLKGLYKGTNLVAVAMDGNNQIVPIAFGICKGETGPCWSWWMSVLKECIGDNPNLLFISDRHVAIALAVEKEFPLAFHAKKNQGTVTRIKTDDNGVFEMLFIAIGASIRTFLNYLRHVLMIDAAHLKGLYKGTNLVAVDMDGNNQIAPIAFGICKGETGPCWSWWMSVLKECVGNTKSVDHFQVVIVLARSLCND